MASNDVPLPSCLITMTSPDFKQKIKLPTSIIKHFEGSIPFEAILRYGTRAWLVRVVKLEAEDVCFQQGWIFFVEDHSLELGDTLMLNFIGNSQFEFKVYDKNGGDKSSPSPPVKVEAASFEKGKDDSVLVGSENNNCEGLNVSSRSTEMKHPFKEEMPRFILYANQKMTYQAKIPGDFLESVGDEELSDTIFLEDTDGKVWPIELGKVNSDQVWLHKGWDEFVKSRGLSNGQCLRLLFEYKGKSHFTVSIYVDIINCELNDSELEEKPSVNQSIGGKGSKSAYRTRLRSNKRSNLSLHSSSSLEEIPEFEYKKKRNEEKQASTQRNDEFGLCRRGKERSQSNDLKARSNKRSNASVNPSPSPEEKPRFLNRKERSQSNDLKANEQKLINRSSRNNNGDDENSFAEPDPDYMQFLMEILPAEQIAKASKSECGIPRNFCRNTCLGLKA